MTRRHLVVVLAVALPSLLLAPPSDALWENTYFPLHVGNEWTYEVSGPAGPAPPLVVSVNASWRSPVTGVVWLHLQDFNGNGHWLMQSSAGRVFELVGVSHELLWYRLGAAPGDSWTMDLAGDTIACSDGASLELVSRDAFVSVPAGQFSTVHIRFTSSKCTGITDEWFARGVGLVRRVLMTRRGPLVFELAQATPLATASIPSTTAIIGSLNVSQTIPQLGTGQLIDAETSAVLPFEAAYPSELGLAVNARVTYETVARPQGAVATSLRLVDYGRVESISRADQTKSLDEGTLLDSGTGLSTRFSQDLALEMGIKVGSVVTFQRIIDPTDGKPIATTLRLTRQTSSGTPEKP
jgi:hypothetical protein